MEDVHAVLRQQLDEAADVVRAPEVARRVEHEAAPAALGLVLDPDGGRLPRDPGARLGRVDLRGKELPQRLHAAREPPRGRSLEADAAGRDVERVGLRQEARVVRLRVGRGLRERDRARALADGQREAGGGAKALREQLRDLAGGGGTLEADGGSGIEAERAVAFRDGAGKGDELRFHGAVILPEIVRLG